jgi:hypothetical protein
MSEREKRFGVLREKEQRLSELEETPLILNATIRGALDPLTHDWPLEIDYSRILDRARTAHEKSQEGLRLKKQVETIKAELGVE